MHKRYYAQRQHLVTTLDGLLYQLHTLSFFLSPSIWMLVFRLASQFQCWKPKEVDLSRSLRIGYSFILLLNIPNLWTHAVHGPAEGRAIILDFVGMGYLPSRFQLFTLDITILLLQWFLITISYETALSANSADGEDTLLGPDTSIPDTLLPTSMSSANSSRPTSPTSSRATTYFKSIHSQPKFTPTTNLEPEILDLRFRSLVARLRDPPPPVIPQRASADSDSALPFPNTTSLPIPAGFRMLIRSQARRNATRGPFEATTPSPLGGSPLGNSRDRAQNYQRVPGGMDRDS